MNGIIDNITTSHCVQARILGISIANAQKAFEVADAKREADEQATRIEDSVKRIVTDLDTMITRFYFLKEHKHMTDYQTKATVNFVSYVKDLTRNVHSLLCRFQKVEGKTFEENLDREIERIEAQVKQRLKEFEEILSGTHQTFRYRLSKYVSSRVAGVKKALKGTTSALEEEKAGRSQAYEFESTRQESVDPHDAQLESFINVLDTGQSSEAENISVQETANVKELTEASVGVV